MPYSLASKTGVMLLSRNVRASVPKYIFRDTSHYQRSELMSDSAALEFTLDNQIFRTFRSVDLSHLVIQTVCITS